MSRNKILTRCSALVLGAALAVSAIPAMAKGPQDHAGMGMMQGRFEQADANKDGALTLEEIQARIAERFAEMDTDKNGSVVPDEISAFARSARDENRTQWRTMHAERMIGLMDRNGDDMLSKEELGAPRSDIMFAQADTDKDGAISKEEFDNAMSRFAGMRHGDDHGDRHGGRMFHRED